MDIDLFRSHFVAVNSLIAEGPIVPNVTANEIQSFLKTRFSFEHPLALEDVVADVERMLQTWQVQVTHPRYFGLFNPSVTLASVVADALVATYNPQLANWRTSPAANEIERHILGWLTRKFGLPSDTIATFTSGGSEANASAVVVALTRAFPEYGEFGLRQLKGAPTIYVTAETHHGFSKIAHMAGLGRRNLRIVKTDSTLKMNVQSLKERISEDRKEGFLPLMVVGTAGTTAAGVIDPLPEIADLCSSEHLWFHVDAAWGGAAILSPTLRGHLAGIEHADSITCDAHKWLSVPMGCGMFFCRHRGSVAEAFRADVNYMPTRTQESGNESATFDPLTHSAQWSRRFIGLKLFLAMAEHGESGYSEMIEHQARLGELLRTLLADSGWRIVNSTPLPVVCFTRVGLTPSRFLSELREKQIVWMSEAMVNGTPVLRACITSFRTTEADVRSIVAEMNYLQPEFSRGHSLEPATVPQSVDSFELR